MNVSPFPKFSLPLGFPYMSCGYYRNKEGRTVISKRLDYVIGDRGVVSDYALLDRPLAGYPQRFVCEGGPSDHSISVIPEPPPKLGDGCRSMVYSYTLTQKFKGYAYLLSLTLCLSYEFGEVSDTFDRKDFFITYELWMKILVDRAYKIHFKGFQFYQTELPPVGVFIDKSGSASIKLDIPLCGIPSNDIRIYLRGEPLTVNTTRELPVSHDYNQYRSMYFRETLSIFSVRTYDYKSVISSCGPPLRDTLVLSLENSESEVSSPPELRWSSIRI